MSFVESLRFVFAERDHWKLALLAAAVFFGGMMSAGLVVRFEIHELMRMPLWVMGFLARFLRAHPRFMPVFLLIFLFNGVAMCVYMLTGVAPALPYVVSFLTGMNIGIVGLLGGGPMAQELQAAPLQERQDEPADAASREAGGCLRGASFTLTMCLELPAFWFALAMGASLTGATPWWATTHPAAELGRGVVERLSAYGMVVVPLLAVSAAVETVGVLQGFRNVRRELGSRHRDDDAPADDDEGPDEDDRS